MSREEGGASRQEVHPEVNSKLLPETPDNESDLPALSSPHEGAHSPTQEDEIPATQPSGHSPIAAAAPRLDPLRHLPAKLRDVGCLEDLFAIDNWPGHYNKAAVPAPGCNK